MNELVKKLMIEQEIEISAPYKNAKKLKEWIDSNYVHVKFIHTIGGTELGFRLFYPECELDADFDNAEGMVRVVGALNLDGVNIKVVADIDLSTCDGYGYVVPLSDDEFDMIISF